MSLYRIQGTKEKRKGIFYEFDPTDEPLGEGGMGKVYRGRCIDENTGSIRNVAIKFMYSDLPPYAIEKARREAAIHFRHDNLIEMLGFIETETKSVLGESQFHYHVVSELLEGVSLDRMFEGKLVDQQGHVVPFAEKLYRDYQQDVNHFAVEITKNILSGLMMMHDAGYIHRDIDPTNIMITNNGCIKLIDFGIAKKFNALTTHDKHLTQAGQFVGKPEYAAPELVLGSINEQNQTTDIYAVGILLFQCIVGHVPFEGDRSDVLQKQLHAPMPLRLIKHKGLRKIIAMATEKSRSKRFQSAAEFRVALERLDLNSGLSPDFKFAPKYLLGGVVVCVLCALTYYFVQHNKPAPIPNPQDEPIEIVMDQSAEPLTYEIAIAAIHQGDLSKMLELSVKGDAKATYLLSRLYFHNLWEEKTGGILSSSYNLNLAHEDFQADSIAYLQKKLSIVHDNKKAHELLLKTIQQDPTEYHAQFDLALDYIRTDDRTDAVDSKRDIDKARAYFRDALSNAKKVNDTGYINMIESCIKRWKL